jgi:hypothetical protein
MRTRCWRSTPLGRLILCAQYLNTLRGTISGDYSHTHCHGHYQYRLRQPLQWRAVDHCKQANWSSNFRSSEEGTYVNSKRSAVAKPTPAAPVTVPTETSFAGSTSPPAASPSTSRPSTAPLRASPPTVRPFTRPTQRPSITLLWLPARLRRLKLQLLFNLELPT